MLNVLWAGMIVIGILFGVINGRMDAITDAALESSREAVSLCITMLGVMAFWVGMMEIAKESGVVERLSKRMKPLLHSLFPRLPENHPAAEYISLNFIANFLGLGWAATPAGLKAMEHLKDLQIERKASPFLASDEMCTFLIMNISSLQLIPIHVITYRSQYGSVEPAAVIAPGILATGISTLSAVLYCRWKMRKKQSV